MAFCKRTKRSLAVFTRARTITDREVCVSDGTKVRAYFDCSRFIENERRTLGPAMWKIAYRLALRTLVEDICALVVLHWLKVAFVFGQIVYRYLPMLR